MALKSLTEYNIAAHHKYHVIKPAYRGITILFVLEGKVNISSNEFHKILSKGDILLINRGMTYKVESDHPNVVLTLEIASHYFSRFYKNYFHSRYLIDTDIPDFKKKYVDNIRVLLANMMIAYIKNSNESLLEVNHSLSSILLLLVSFFRETSVKVTSQMTWEEQVYSRRIKNTIRFLEENYNKQVSLQQAANNEYVSFSYLSRLFKKEVGIGFLEYLNNIKFEHAMYDLMHTKRPIYQIIEEHGFSDIKQFTKLFKERYQTTPNQYRIEYQSNQTNIIVNTHDDKTITINQEEQIVEVSDLLPLLVNIVNTNELTHNEFASYDEQVIDIKKHSLSENIPTAPYIIFVGELQELLKENVKQQLLLLKETTHINYVEISHLISGDTILPEIITDEPSPTHSPYHNSDLAISFLQKNNISLFIRICHSSFKVVKEHYLDKTIKFIQHYINFYDANYAQSWKFIYYVDKNELNCHNVHEVFEHYYYIRYAIKSCIPECDIGLFFPIINEEGNIEVYGADYIFNHIDFLAYSATPTKNRNTHLSNDQIIHNEVMYLHKKTKKIKESLKKMAIHLPLYLMEWNTLTGHTRHTNGSYFRGALIFHTLLALFQHVNGIGIVLNSEMQKEENKPNFIDTSRIALFYLFNTRRPIFYVLKFLDKLNGKIIARSTNYLITESAYGYQCILTNVSVFNPYISLQEHLIQSFQKRKLISILGLRPGNYQIKKYTFDQQNGALYRQYLQFHTKFGYDKDTIEYINHNTMPSLSVYDENIDDKWEVLAELDINAIHFYELKRVSLLEEFELSFIDSD